MKNRWFALVALLLIAGALIGCRVSTQTSRVLARVNGVELTEQDLEREMNHSKAFYREQYGYNLDAPEYADLLAQVEQDALMRIVDQELIRQLADEASITVTDAEVQALADQYEAQFANREELLAINGFATYDEFLDFVRGNLRVGALAETYGLRDEAAFQSWFEQARAEAAIELYLFSVPTNFAGGLDQGQVSAELQDQFQSAGHALPSPQVQVEQAGSVWTIEDAATRYVIRKENQELDVYEVYGRE